MTTPELEQRALAYCADRRIEIQVAKRLGWGQDGYVWKTSVPSAVKALHRWSNYYTERRCYQRLMEREIRSIEGLRVPRLIGFNDDLQVVEMEVVERPYLIDFGKAYIDEPAPDYGPEVLAETEEIQREIWGSHYRRVQSVLSALRQFGIEYVDPRPSNILFEDWDLGAL